MKSFNVLTLFICVSDFIQLGFERFKPEDLLEDVLH